MCCSFFLTANKVSKMMKLFLVVVFMLAIGFTIFQLFISPFDAPKLGDFQPIFQLGAGLGFVSSAFVSVREFIEKSTNSSETNIRFLLLAYSLLSAALLLWSSYSDIPAPHWVQFTSLIILFLPLLLLLIPTIKLEKAN